MSVVRTPANRSRSDAQNLVRRSSHTEYGRARTDRKVRPLAKSACRAHDHGDMERNGRLSSRLAASSRLNNVYESTGESRSPPRSSERRRRRSKSGDRWKNDGGEFRRALHRRRSTPYHDIAEDRHGASTHMRKPERPKHAMKPSKYDGSSSVDTFLIQFATCADYNKWDAEERCANLKCCLAGSVGQIL